eukprot:2624436-Pyramimonas_sp.AAC.1
MIPPLVLDGALKPFVFKPHAGDLQPVRAVRAATPRAAARARLSHHVAPGPRHRARHLFSRRGPSSR